MTQYNIIEGIDTSTSASVGISEQQIFVHGSKDFVSNDFVAEWTSIWDWGWRWCGFYLCAYLLERKIKSSCKPRLDLKPCKHSFLHNVLYHCKLEQNPSLISEAWIIAHNQSFSDSPEEKKGLPYFYIPIWQTTQKKWLRRQCLLKWQTWQLQKLQNCSKKRFRLFSALLQLKSVFNLKRANFKPAKLKQCHKTWGIFIKSGYL